MQVIDIVVVAATEDEQFVSMNCSCVSPASRWDLSESICSKVEFDAVDLSVLAIRLNERFEVKDIDIV